MKIKIALLALFMLAIIAGEVSANTIDSSTMYFEGALTADGSGGYTGTIPAVAGTYYIAGGPGTVWNSISGRYETPDGQEAVGGFDVYAQDGGCAYVQCFYSTVAWNCNGFDTAVVPPSYDAYAAGGPWGSWYAPDVADYQNYKLHLNGDGTWSVRGFDYSDAYAGTINWNSKYATETGQNWNPTWSWGEEDIPLECQGFEVTVTQNPTRGTYNVKMAPKCQSDEQPPDGQEIPEFPTAALPAVIAVGGYLMLRRRKQE